MQPPPRATSVPPRSSRSACQSASSDSTLFACSPGASSWLARARALERELHVHPVDPGDARVADDLDRPVAGNELAEPLERADLDVDAASDENGTFDVPGARIRSVVVERLPLLVQRPESRLVLRKRAVATADAAPRLLGVDLDEDRHGALAQCRADLVGSDRAAAQRDHRRRSRAQSVECVLRLAQPERCLASGLEDPRDRFLAFDLAVDVDERPPELLRERLAQSVDLPAPMKPIRAT